MTQNTPFVNQMTQNTLFYGHKATVDKILTLENIIQGQLKLGEHQANCRAMGISQSIESFFYFLCVRCEYSQHQQQIFPTIKILLDL